MDCLNQIRQKNEEEIRQLTLNYQENANEYLRSVSRKNLREISELVNKFIAAYLRYEENRQKFFGKQKDLPKFPGFDSKCIVYNKIDALNVPVGYSQRIPNLTAVVAEKAQKSNEHFTCKAEDRNLVVSIKSLYLDSILDTVKKLKQRN